MDERCIVWVYTQIALGVITSGQNTDSIYEYHVREAIFHCFDHEKSRSLINGLQYIDMNYE